MNITTNTSHTVKQLLGDIILAEILPMDRTSIGGIYIPESVSTLNTQKNGIPACVLMVGSDFVHKDVVKKGDIIYVSKYLGTVIDVTKQDIRIYDGEDVLAILNNNE